MATLSRLLALGRAKPSSVAVSRTIDREADARQRPGAERRLRQGLLAHLPEPPLVADEHLDVGQQVMGQPHRLGTLQVRVARAGACPGVAAAWSTRTPARSRDRRPLCVDGIAQVQQDVGGDLIVAAAAGVQPPPGIPDQLGQAPLDGGMDVLVGRLDGERPVPELRLDPVEPVGDRPPVSLGQHAGLHQHAGVRARAGDVLGPHARVDRERGVQRSNASAGPPANRPPHSRAPSLTAPPLPDRG